MAITGELANIVVNTNYNDIPKETIEDTNDLVIDFVGAASGWKLSVSPNVKEIAPSTPDELGLLRTLDPEGMFIGD